MRLIGGASARGNAIRAGETACGCLPPGASLVRPSSIAKAGIARWAMLSELEAACSSLKPGTCSVRPSRVAKASIAMSGVTDGTNRARRFVADSGCNVHLCSNEGDLHDAKVVHFQVVGTAGASSVTKTGTIVGSGKDYNGEKVDFKFKCSALPGLSMNLLSISQLLTPKLACRRPRCREGWQ